MRLEVQFHTDETFALKMRYHDNYKQDFELQMQGASVEQRVACLEEARQACRQVATPAGCEHIGDWNNEPPQVNKRRAQAKAAQLPGAGAGKRPDAMATQVERLRQAAGRIEREVGPLLQTMQLHVIREHSVVKKAKSIEKKIQRLCVLNGITPEQAADRVRDAMRWIIQLPHETFGAHAQKALETLTANGLRITRVNNSFMARNRTYAGLNVKLQTREALNFEIQFHTGDSLYTRNKTHKIYRQWQDTDVEQRQATDPAQRQALQKANTDRLAALKTYAATVPTPIGAERIPSFDRYRRDGARQDPPGDGPHEAPARDRASASSSRAKHAEAALPPPPSDGVAKAEPVRQRPTPTKETGCSDRRRRDLFCLS